MAFRAMAQRGARLPIKASLVAAGSIYFATGTAHAEAPQEKSQVISEKTQLSKTKKPIYDDISLSSPTPSSSSSSSSSSPSSSSSSSSALSSSLAAISNIGRDDTSPSSSSDTSSTSSPETPTPTDRLAGQIKRARLFLHAHAAGAEDRLNDMMTSFLQLETSFTSTVASLAPPKESGERLMPGAIYVLVAAMTGSIVSRNRNLLLRASVPVALGIGAGWVVLPITMRNVGDLAWKYEEKVPVISNGHMRIRGFTEEAWRMAKARGEGAVKTVDEKIKEGRGTVEEWVKKGR
ncbi:MAG: hypothetical protein M1837_003474 [Sclerophora amabilis]|nr:MAG: hypothetical protein M1837_003474 [Sclerophora amabilis]